MKELILFLAQCMMKVKKTQGDVLCITLNMYVVLILVTEQYTPNVSSFVRVLCSFV